MARILVVDDDPDVVESLTVVLERAGHTVNGAKNRKEGVAAVRREAPDLVVLDVMMDEPDDGFVLAQDLRRDGFKQPILMLTSIGRVMGLSYGTDAVTVPVDEFVEKPVAPRILLDKVQALLGRKDG